MPHRSWWKLCQNLGSEMVAQMAGLSLKDLETYLDDRITAAEVVGQRLDFLVDLYRLLSAHNPPDVIRQWLDEHYVWLGDKTPREIFSGHWYPSDIAPGRVMELIRFKADRPLTLRAK